MNLKDELVWNYGGVEAWLDVNGIANIFIILDLKKLGYHITYESYDGYYLVTNKKKDAATKFI